MRSALLAGIVLISLCPLAGADTVPWPEHPRPDFQRPAWLNLNGQWAFDFDPKGEGEAAGWHRPGHKFSRQITVPFPWESKLSGIGDTQYQGAAWYSREVTLPSGPEWQHRNPWLVIGACDWEATVWIDGRLAGRHVGGYVPFAINLSAFAGPGEKIAITIRAIDNTDPQQPVGKQRNWYTRTSGIWQTVYLEPRGSRYIESIRAFPNIAEGTVKFSVVCPGESGGGTLTVRSPEGAFNPRTIELSESGGDTQGRPREVTIRVKEPKLWTPDSPTLYRVVFDLQDVPNGLLDSVESYFGLREISTAKAPGREYRYICLNGKPIYLRGALHQSFHPDGIYQYPDDATMRGDYELCKRIGLNCLRIHIKIPVPRELYWADKLGVLIMQDMPNFDRNTPQARQWYEEMLKAAVARDFNQPAIFAWVTFNETWGLNNPGPYDAERQEWAAKIYALTKRLDPTRLVEDQSPCNHDHVISDINSWHFYENDYAKAKQRLQEDVDKIFPGSTFNYIGGRKQTDAPFINSEYGGIDCSMGDQDISWSFKFLTNEFRKHDKMCGYIYTELSDIEWEHNGFVNYDRSPKEFGYEFWHPGFSLKDLNSPDFIVIDAPPMIELQPGQETQVPIKISHWSEHEAKELKLRWCVHWPIDKETQLPPIQHTDLNWETRAAQWRPYTVVDQGPITLPPQDHLTVGALLVELLDGDAVLARNYINLWQPSKLTGITTTKNGYLTLAFSPGDFTERTFATTEPVLGEKDAGWVAGQGSGYYEYNLKIPEGVDPDQVDIMVVGAEMASRWNEGKLDWPTRRKHHDRPQTDTTKWPSNVEIRINGEKIEERHKLRDDPADARGALSHYHGLRGGYGELITAWLVDGEPLHTIKWRRIRNAARQERLLKVRFEVPPNADATGGLTIYGEGVGRYGLPPSVTLWFKEGYHLPSGLDRAGSAAVHRARDNVRVLVPTADTAAHEWLYTTDAPAGEWAAANFDASTWKKGLGSFGMKGTPNSVVRTAWDAHEIWMRTAFTLDDPAAVREAAWRIYHNEDAEVYLNGQKVLTRPGMIMQYLDLPLELDAMKALVKGRNVLAVHCRWTSDDHNIDVGLTVVGKPPPAVGP